MSDLPVPRETRAGCVTARRPPCQRAGLETDSAPGGSPCVASDAQVRPAAGLQGTRRLAAAAELSWGESLAPPRALSSRELQRVPSHPPPLGSPVFPAFLRVLGCRASRQFLRARSPPRGPCSFYSASVSLCSVARRLCRLPFGWLLFALRYLLSPPQLPLRLSGTA